MPLRTHSTRATALLVAVAVAAFARPGQSQEDALPAFDVASVRLANGGPLIVKSDPGRLTIRDVAVDVLIQLAFGLREYQYQGPAWLHTTRYDIEATTASPQPRAVELAMLRALLIDRFKLKIHR